MPTICAFVSGAYLQRLKATRGREPYQHVEVVEAAGARILRNARRGASYTLDRGPILPVVPRYPPRVAHAVAPSPDAVAPPLAEVVVDLLGAADAAEGVAHGLVPRARVELVAPAGLGRLPVGAGRVARVVLPKVDAPAGEQPRVLRLATPRAGVPGAGHGAHAAVEAELEPHAVDLVDGGLDAVGPLARVRNEVA